ncbi:AraC family transcriptional regulator [Dietzia sp. PP-33]|jgi:AraC-like DNA-binding protein/mannose-6-phosphate isomerase-like protein (cupin superfamily)|uniref:helix-turn-helix domain-containing protein n=1 Tax=Dietzia sp. PP-33 TaxID=2957500 RepID=UPI0029B952A8|nr:AraC family transcriptional regulator [Dietzia sp. PP-33]MDX2355946.1 AraC family transcriptional regulator [Dietzia sp. PP-33]
MTGTSSSRRGGIDTRTLPVYEAGAAVMPFVITGMDELVSRDTEWEPHSHPTHELLWNRSGASTASIGSRTWTITPSVGLWIPAGVLHSATAPAGTWYRTAHVDVRTTSTVPAEPVAVEVTPLLTLLLERLVDHTLHSRSRELTEQMVFDLLEPSPLALLVHKPTSELLRPIVAALESRPGDDRSLTDWAARLGVSERTVTRAFRAETGLSFGAWQAALRAQHAALLLGGEMAVDEVAARVGYSSASAFGAAFRRTTGLTPDSSAPPGGPRPAQTMPRRPRPARPRCPDCYTTRPDQAIAPLTGRVVTS